MKENIFDDLREYCPREYITRKELKRITGGLICGNTMAQFDRLGKGIQNRKIIGCKTVYFVDDLIEWLKRNTELINFDN